MPEPRKATKVKLYFELDDGRAIQYEFANPDEVEFSSRPVLKQEDLHGKLDPVIRAATSIDHYAVSLVFKARPTTDKSGAIFTSQRLPDDDSSG